MLLLSQCNNPPAFYVSTSRLDLHAPLQFVEVVYAQFFSPNPINSIIDPSSVTWRWINNGIGCGLLKNKQPYDFIFTCQFTATLIDHTEGACSYNIFACCCFSLRVSHSVLTQQWPDIKRISHCKQHLLVSCPGTWRIGWCSRCRQLNFCWLLSISEGETPQLAAGLKIMLS